MNVRLNRFDSIVAQAQADNRGLGSYGEYFLRQALDSAVNFDDDEAAAHSRALETLWAREIEQPRAPLPLAQGDLLPDSQNVEEGSTTYRYWLISDQGDAQWSASMTGSDMPTTSLSSAEMTGVIETIEGGYVYSRKQLRNSNKGNVRLIPRSSSASLRAHMEVWDEALAWGKESIGILGMFNHPLLGVITAADNGSGSTSWRDKTIDQIAADVSALLNSIPQQTNELLNATKVLMSPRLFRFCQQTRMENTAGDGSTTILRHLERIFAGTSDPNVAAPRFPVTFGVVRYLDATNPRSQGNLVGDSLYAYIDNDPDVIARVNGFVGRTYPPQEDDLMIKVPGESEVGGVEVAQPLGLQRMDAVFFG
jgi:hypothetical protein